MLTSLGTGRPAQIAIATSAVIIVVGSIGSILISQLTGAPIPNEVQILLAFITGSGTTLLGHQQASNALLRAQQAVPEIQNATTNGGNGAH